MCYTAERYNEGRGAHEGRSPCGHRARDDANQAQCADAKNVISSGVGKKGLRVARTKTEEKEKWSG